MSCSDRTTNLHTAPVDHLDAHAYSPTYCSTDETYSKIAFTGSSLHGSEQTYIPQTQIFGMTTPHCPYAMTQRVNMQTLTVTPSAHTLHHPSSASPTCNRTCTCHGAIVAYCICIYSLNQPPKQNREETHPHRASPPILSTLEDTAAAAGQAQTATRKILPTEKNG
jgi:hypothetical protein